MKRKLIIYVFHIVYRCKYLLLKPILGHEARAYILYNAIFPEIVLTQGNAKIGHNVRIGRWLSLHESKNSFRNLEIGNDVHIGKHVFIDLSGKVTIRDRAGIGMKTSIITHINLGDSLLSKSQPPKSAPVEVGEDAVTNIGVTILQGVSIANKVLCLPNAVISTSISSGKLVGGNPQRILRDVD